VLPGRLFPVPGSPVGLSSRRLPRVSAGIPSLLRWRARRPFYPLLAQWSKFYHSQPRRPDQSFTPSCRVCLQVVARCRVSVP